jgi:hypothetical protein
MAYNPSAVRIQRMLGATQPIRPPTLPKPMAAPKLGSQLSDRMLMRPGRADGGGIADSPYSPFAGGIMSTGAGRADDVPMHVPNGSYVMPAWAVSHMGEGNTVNGMTLLKAMFGSPLGGQKTPFGAPSPPLSVGKGPRGPAMPHPAAPAPLGLSGIKLPTGMPQENPALAAQKHGGAATGGNGAIPINASGGEFVIEPDEVARIGDGDVNKGHRILDKWVLHLKKEAANTLKRLPGPAK